MSFDFVSLVALAEGKAQADVACPICGPGRRDPRNRSRLVLRLWYQPDFVSFHCARCGERGYVRADEKRLVDPEAWGRQRAEIAMREKVAEAIQLDKARWLWRQRRPIAGTVAEHYLRAARGITLPLPPTLGFLPAHDAYSPTMIAALGMATEPGPGMLSIADQAVRGVHLTRLKPDGSGKAEDPAKIMVGRSKGFPIVLGPMNDLLGLLIAEGIEDALSAHQATGLGVWAAGSASRLPALIDQVPCYADCVTVMGDDDTDGRRHATALVEDLLRRGIYAELSIPGAEG